MGKENDLINAVKEGNGQYVRKSLHKFRKSSRKHTSKKSTINVPDTEGFTALHHAALLGDVDVLMSLVEMDADPNSRDTKGMTPLHLAAWAGKEAALKALLESRGLPNLPSSTGDTALHLAAQHGYSTCAKVLLENHADAAFRNNCSETPLDLACQFGHTGVVRLLLNNEKVTFLLISPDSNSQYKSPMHLAAKSGHDDIVHLLIQAGANINETRPQGTPLHQAALYGKTDVVRLLIQAGADVHRSNKKGLMPLDLVNRFTASKAGLAIKQMLREAAGERVEYAKAVSDYNNQYDGSCLSFKSGDSIAVIEQNENGRWRGYVVGAAFQDDKVGYFPAMAVHLIHQSRATPSISSVGSVTSNESIGNHSLASRSTSPSKPVTPSQPVGVVPIGNFEMVTLAQNDSNSHVPPKQTASGTVPTRMSSFKQKNSHARHQYQSPPAQPAPPPSASPVQHQQQTPPNQVSSSPQPSPVQRQLFQQPVPPRRVVSERAANHQSIHSGVQTLGRHTVRENSSQDFRSRTASAGSAQSEIAKSIQQAVKNRVEDHNRAVKYAAVENDHYININDQYSNQKRGVSNIKPILTKSKSQDSYNQNKISINNDTKVNGSHVKFAPVQNNLNKVNLSNELSHNTEESDTPPQLPIKRSQTLPSDYVRHENAPSMEHFNSFDQPESISMKQRHQVLYENTNIPGINNNVPGSPRSPASPDSIDGSFAYPGEYVQRLSMSEQELINWLIDLKLTCYFENFRSNGFDMTSVRGITPEDLSYIEISKTGHRKKLLTEITKLPPSDQLSNEKPHDVGAWLGQLNLRQYEPNFIEGGFDDIDFIKDLDRNDLEMIDIKKKGHQKKILMAVQRLNELELTAILDIAVAESPLKRVPSFREYSQPDTQTFFAETFTADLTSTRFTLSPREDLPPPSGEEQKSISPKHQSTSVVSVLPKLKSQRSPPIMSQLNGDVKQPVVAPKPSAKPAVAPPPAAPKPKPKPKAKPPVALVNGNVATDAGSPASVVTSGLIQGDQNEMVKSSKSRDFFKQQEQKQKEDSPPNTMERRPSHTPKKSPVPPPAAPKPRSSSSSSNNSDKAAPPPPVAAKKVPPPAPPVRAGSLTGNSITTAAPLSSDLPPTEDMSQLAVSPRMPSFKPPPPPPVKQRVEPPPEVLPAPEPSPPPTEVLPPLEPSPPTEVLPPPEPSPPPTDFLPPPPNFSPPPPVDLTLPPPTDISSPPPEFTLPPPPVEDSLAEQAPVNVSSNIIKVEPVTVQSDTKPKNDEFAETDSIMKDLMADIDDFEAQLDSMF